jgi:hypothetical protein
VLVILGAVGYGASKFVHITVGIAGTGNGPVLTAVGGCAGLQEATGRLERVSGSSLVVKTASGQPVTVTTTPSTFVNMSGHLLSEIKDGAPVVVHGTRSGGAITAVVITAGPPSSAVAPQGFVTVRGTVAGASAAGFIVVTSSGTRVPVTISADTLVIVPHASLGQLHTGANIFAIGHAGSHGTLSARAVAAVSPLPSGGPIGGHLHLHVGFHTRVSGHGPGCSPGAIAAALAGG